MSNPTPPIRIIFATNNAHKVEEIQSAIGDSLEVISLHQAGIHIDIPEPHDTLEANASEKSGTIHRLTRAPATPAKREPSKRTSTCSCTGSAAAPTAAPASAPSSP
jgi:hypothetical protein